MTRATSSILRSAYRPCHHSDYDSGDLTCAFLIDMPCARSIPFPTAAAMRCDIGNSNPENIVWKKLIAPKYPLTVDCRLLCTKPAKRHKPEQIRQRFLGVSERVQPRFLPLRFSALVSLLPRWSISIDRFSVYSCRTEPRASVSTDRATSSLCLPLLSPVPAGACANSTHSQ